MQDIKLIRQQKDHFDSALSKRGYKEITSDQILAVDDEIRDLQTKIQELQRSKNDVAKQIGMAKAKGLDAEHLFSQAEEIKGKLPESEALLKEKQDVLRDILVKIPNLLQDDVHEGKDENDNKEVRKFTASKTIDFVAKEHYELGKDLNLMDFQTPAKISGSRFAILQGDLALLERALANFMLDCHTEEYGYTEVNHPALVKSDAMFGTGQLPKFADDSFRAGEEHWLIPTSEVYLTNLVSDKIVGEEELPMRFTAYSQCFRSEAGSAGRDTHGLIRQHQFSKVELVSIVKPENSNEEHERMLAAAENVLKKLDLTFRTMLLCSGDTGFSASKTFDIEVWLPGQGKFREISSCSNCLEFQARRMNARFKSADDKKNHFVHTLNGSGLAVGRTIVAILENYQNADGTIAIPDALVKYMKGKTKIG